MNYRGNLILLPILFTLLLSACVPTVSTTLEDVASAFTVTVNREITVLDEETFVYRDDNLLFTLIIDEQALAVGLLNLTLEEIKLVYSESYIVLPDRTRTSVLPGIKSWPYRNNLPTEVSPDGFISTVLLPGTFVGEAIERGLAGRGLETDDIFSYPLSVPIEMRLFLTLEVSGEPVTLDVRMSGRPSP